MRAEIDKKNLEHLAKLARIELEAEEEEGILRDLRRILGHFDELREISEKGAPPMTGGTALHNVFREDGSRESTDQGKGKKSFPASQRGLLKVPPVFE